MLEGIFSNWREQLGSAVIVSNSFILPLGCL